MKILFGLFSLFLSGLVSATPLNKIVIFGDSLSDNGNLYKLYKIPISPPYFEGRFSNGPVWVEALAESYFHENTSAHLLNYAFGGAVVKEENTGPVFSLKLEIALYLGAHQDRADENSLYIIWMGGNNYLMTPQDEEETLTQVDTGIRHGVQSLVEAGAKHIMLVNLPDLGVAPFASEFYSGDQIPIIREKLTSYCNRHNELLLKTFNDFKQSNPEVQWLYFDANRNYKTFLEAPENYGIHNIKDACLSFGANKPTEQSLLEFAPKVNSAMELQACEDYLFFDAVHPTVKAHKIIAEFAKAVLDEEGVEFTG